MHSVANLRGKGRTPFPCLDFHRLNYIGYRHLVASNVSVQVCGHLGHVCAGGTNTQSIIPLGATPEYPAPQFCKREQKTPGEGYGSGTFMILFQCRTSAALKTFPELSRGLPVTVYAFKTRAMLF